jgi:hypothetical protein
LISSTLSGTSAITKTPSSLVFRDPAAVSLLSVGEELKVSIVQRLSARQYLVAFKDRMIRAESQTPLHAGDELRVRVDQQHPQLVLRVLSENTATRNILLENLRFFRANLEGLVNNLAKTEDLLAQAALHPLLSPLLLDDIRTILKLMQTLGYSRSALDNRDYLRDYLTDLGFLMENYLKKALLTKSEQVLRNDRAPGGLKGLLSKLLEKMNVLLKDENLGEDLQFTLKQLQMSTEKTIKIIENQQIINVMLQETGNACLLQIPLVFPGGMKLGEILIRRNDQADQTDGGRRSFMAELFFDLDILGHILIELHCTDKQIGCLCKCEETAVREFISPRLPELLEKLVTSGYRVEWLNCVLEKDLDKQRLARRTNYQPYAAESIDMFV